VNPSMSGRSSKSYGGSGGTGGDGSGNGKRSGTGRATRAGEVPNGDAKDNGNDSSGGNHEKKPWKDTTQRPSNPEFLPDWLTRWSSVAPHPLTLTPEMLAITQPQAAGSMTRNTRWSHRPPVGISAAGVTNDSGDTTNSNGDVDATGTANFAFRLDLLPEGVAFHILKFFTPFELARSIAPVSRAFRDAVRDYWLSIESMYQERFNLPLSPLFIVSRPSPTIAEYNESLLRSRLMPLPSPESRRSRSGGDAKDEANAKFQAEKQNMISSMITEESLKKLVDSITSTSVLPLMHLSDQTPSAPAFVLTYAVPPRASVFARPPPSARTALVATGAPCIAVGVAPDGFNALLTSGHALTLQFDSEAISLAEARQLLLADPRISRLIATLRQTQTLPEGLIEQFVNNLVEQQRPITQDGAVEYTYSAGGRVPDCVPLAFTVCDDMLIVGGRWDYTNANGQIDPNLPRPAASRSNKPLGRFYVFDAGRRPPIPFTIPKALRFGILKALYSAEVQLGNLPPLTDHAKEGEDNKNGPATREELLPRIRVLGLKEIDSLPKLPPLPSPDTPLPPDFKIGLTREQRKMLLKWQRVQERANEDHRSDFQRGMYILANESAHEAALTALCGWRDPLGEEIRETMQFIDVGDVKAPHPYGRLTTGSNNGIVSSWSLCCGERLCAWQAHQGAVSALLSLPNGDVISASLDGTVRCWTLVEDEHTRALNEEMRIANERREARRRRRLERQEHIARIKEEISKRKTQMSSSDKLDSFSVTKTAVLGDGSESTGEEKTDAGKDETKERERTLYDLDEEALNDVISSSDEEGEGAEAKVNPYALFLLDSITSALPMEPASRTNATSSSSQGKSAADLSREGPKWLAKIERLDRSQVTVSDFIPCEPTPYHVEMEVRRAIEFIAESRIRAKQQSEERRKARRKLRRAERKLRDTTAQSGSEDSDSDSLSMDDEDRLEAEWERTQLPPQLLAMSLDSAIERLTQLMTRQRKQFKQRRDDMANQTASSDCHDSAEKVTEEYDNIDDAEEEMDPDEQFERPTPNPPATPLRVDELETMDIDFEEVDVAVENEMVAQATRESAYDEKMMTLIQNSWLSLIAAFDPAAKREAKVEEEKKASTSASDSSTTAAPETPSEVRISPRTTTNANTHGPQAGAGEEKSHLNIIPIPAELEKVADKLKVQGHHFIFPAVHLVNEIPMPAGFGPVRCMAREGTILFVGGDGGLCVFDLRTGELVRHLMAGPEHREYGRVTALCPIGGLIALGLAPRPTEPASKFFPDDYPFVPFDYVPPSASSTATQNEGVDPIGSGQTGRSSSSSEAGSSSDATRPPARYRLEMFNWQTGERYYTLYSGKWCVRSLALRLPPRPMLEPPKILDHYPSSITRDWSRVLKASYEIELKYQRTATLICAFNDTHQMGRVKIWHWDLHSGSPHAAALDPHLPTPETMASAHGNKDAVILRRAQQPRPNVFGWP